MAKMLSNMEGNECKKKDDKDYNQQFEARVQIHAYCLSSLIGG